MMKKYIVVKPWKKGQRAGEIFETKKLHKVLKVHVIEQPGATAEPEKAKQKK